jgi:hypothetical protein
MNSATGGDRNVMIHRLKIEEVVAESGAGGTA